MKSHLLADFGEAGPIRHFDQDQHRELAAQVHHARIENISAPAMNMGGQFSHNSRAIRADCCNNELRHGKTLYRRSGWNSNGTSVRSARLLNIWRGLS